MIGAVLGIISTLAFTFYIGYLVGSNKKYKEKNNISIEYYDEEYYDDDLKSIPIDADTNRQISNIAYSGMDPKVVETLKELTKKINNYAQNGRKFINVWEECDDTFKCKIEKYLTKKDIIEWFKPYNYKIVFMYDCLDDPDIKTISWR